MDKPGFKTEVCIDDLEQAIQAEIAGASRLELCVSLLEGGVTPQQSLIEKVCGSVKIPVHVMVRPRPGLFTYNDDELELMKTDIKHCIAAGARGVVFGILKSDGTVDVERNREMLTYAKTIHATFHRAFDFTPEPFHALEEVITCGFNSILTSGQAQTASDGLEVIRELVKRAEDRIEIIAGSGVNATNVKLLHEAGVKTFHFTCRKKAETSSERLNNTLYSLSSGGSVSTYEVYEFDKEKFNGIFETLRNEASYE